MKKNYTGKNLQDKEDSINEKQNSFCSKKENKKNNMSEIERQKTELINNSGCFFFGTSSYSNSHRKLYIKYDSQEKKNIIKKYWLLKPEKKFEYYGNQIKTIWREEEIWNISDSFGIFMVFKNCLTEQEYERFDRYFTVIIKSRESQYLENSSFGKLLYIGGDLKSNLGNVIGDEFSMSDVQNNSLPLYLCITKYNEYEKIELEAMDLCNRDPNINGFGDNSQKFNKNFSYYLSKKFNKIKKEKRQKKESLKNEGKKDPKKDLKKIRNITPFYIKLKLMNL